MSTGVAEKFKAWKAQLQAVEINRDLSDEGRAKQLATLQKQMSDYQPQALSAFTREANAIRKEFHSLNDVRWPAAVEAAARQLDFSRLAYERDRMASDVSVIKATTNEPGAALEAKYNAVMSSGDVYAQRAWSELGQPLAIQFGGAALAARMEQNAETLRTTDEMKTLQAQSGKLALRAAALQREIREVKPEIHGFETQMALEKVMDGIHVSERIDAATLALETSLSVDAPTAEAAAPVGAPVAA